METFLEPALNVDESKRKPNVEYITEIDSISFGIDHSLLLDKEGRVFSNGFNRYGRLGHGDEKERIKPTLIESLK